MSNSPSKVARGMRPSSPDHSIPGEESELRNPEKVESGDKRSAGSVEELADERSSDFSTIESETHSAEKVEEQKVSTQEKVEERHFAGRETPSDHDTISAQARSPTRDGKLCHDFYWNCMELKAQLIRLEHSLRSIGSSGPLTKATYALKDAARKLRDVYGKNAATLFPDNGNYNVKEYKSGGSFAYLREFPVAFKDFREALDETAPALHDFSGVYHDEKLVLQLFSLHNRFNDEVAKISSNGSQTAPELFAKQMQTVLAEWLMEAIKSLTGALKSFTDKGVPAIQAAQSFSMSRYLDMTTIAVLLSGTTASMLQITVDESEDSLRAAATTCLFASLVFSVGSALSSLLVIGWRKSVIRSPDSTLPLWLKIWFSTGPMISLLLSGVSFALGVCLFVFTAGNRSWTSAITVALTGLHASLLVLLLGFFIRERWSFDRKPESALTTRGLILSGLEWLYYAFTSPIRSYDRQTSLSRAESGVNSGMTLMNTTEDSSSGEKFRLDSTPPYPTSIWHSLSDEKFLLGARYQYDLATSGTKTTITMDERITHAPPRRHDAMVSDNSSEGLDDEPSEISYDESDSGETEWTYTSSFGIVQSAALFLPSSGIRQRIRRD